MQHLRAGHTALFREGKGRRGDGCGRMDDGAQMGIIVVEQVPANRVDECRTQRIEPFHAAEHCDALCT
ncbi:MAG TPA: hypothetical protein VGM32_16485 [Rhodopila sp.]